MSGKQRDREPAEQLSEESFRQALYDADMEAREAIPLTPAQKAEAERRLLEYERNPGIAVPLEEVMRRLKSHR